MKKRPLKSIKVLNSDQMRKLKGGGIRPSKEPPKKEGG